MRVEKDESEMIKITRVAFLFAPEMQAAWVFLPTVVLLLTFTGLVSVLYDYPKTKRNEKRNHDFRIYQFT